jgi:hypothetical protein
MKRIITLIILMLLIKRIAFCQEIEYYEHDEYERDSTGVYILIENPEETKYIVIKKSKAGTIDIHNNVIIPIIYDGLSSWVENGSKAHFVKNKGKFGLISHEGRIIILIEYEYVGLPQASVIVVRKNGKYGAISWNNKEILPCIYDNIFDDIPDSDLRDEKDEKKGKLVTL